jgi:putative membrane protein
MIFRNFVAPSGILVHILLRARRAMREREMRRIAITGMALLVSITGMALLVSTAAFAQSLGEKTGIDSLLGVSPSTQDFVTEATMGGMFEVESSKLAVQKADGPVKQFASQMVADHTKASEELAAQAKSQKFSVPTTLDDSDQGKIDKLRGLAGADFSKQYMDYQVSAHKDAVSLFQRYGKGGDNSKLKAWAVTTLPTLQHHLDMAEGLDR